jgi:hypothetical protein
MTPLDQIDRDWTLGNCYYITLEFLKDSKQLQQDGSIPTAATIRLVHGLLDSENRKVKHAWIEVDNDVIDHSNNQSIRAINTDYYTDNTAQAIKRFTREQADALLSHLRAKDGGLPISYWGDFTDEKIQKALSEFRPENSVFESGVSFSDPNDPANDQNLVAK